MTIHNYEYFILYYSLKVQHDSQNLIRKKMYKTFMSTCLDVNKSASAVNTTALQAKKSQVASLSVNAGGNNSVNNLSTQILSARSELASKGELFSTATTNLSLIVAAGFNKGEIHVFDLFKNDASVFYNNAVKTSFS
jgi:hypothetical protein